MILMAQRVICFLHCLKIPFFYFRFNKLLHSHTLLEWSYGSEMVYGHGGSEMVDTHVCIRDQ